MLEYTSDLNQYLTHIQLQQMDRMIFLKMFIPFRAKYKVEAVDMDNLYMPIGRYRRFYVKIKNILKCVSQKKKRISLSVIDRQLPRAY
jgi:hypothetical protein